MKKIFFIVCILTSLFYPAYVNAEAFIWPSDGYIGWKYYTDTNGQEGINGTYHTGIDIWGQQNGDWNNGITGNSNAVYSAYQGQVIYVDSLGLIVEHSPTLYTKYWHLRNRQVSTSSNVSTNTILGYQDFANAVHIHVTVASSSAGYDADYTLDPSSYFGAQLNVNNPNPVPWLYQVSRNTSCGGSEVTIANQNITGSSNCSATNLIKILPETNIIGEHIFYIQ